MGTLPTWLREKVFFYIRQPRLFSFLSSWSDSNWLSQSLRRDKSLAKSLHFFSSFLPPPLANFSWMGQGGQSLSSLPLDWVRRLKLNVWFKIVLAFPASCFFFLFFMALREARKTMSNRPQSNHLRWAHSEGINAFYMRMPSLWQSPLSNMWENSLSLSSLLSPCSRSLSLFLPLFYLLKL